MSLTLNDVGKLSLRSRAENITIKSFPLIPILMIMMQLTSNTLRYRMIAQYHSIIYGLLCSEVKVRQDCKRSYYYSCSVMLRGEDEVRLYTSCFYL